MTTPFNSLTASRPCMDNAACPFHAFAVLFGRPEKWPEIMDASTLIEESRKTGLPVFTEYDPAVWNDLWNLCTDGPSLRKAPCHYLFSLRGGRGTEWTVVMARRSLVEVVQ